MKRIHLSSTFLTIVTFLLPVTSLRAQDEPVTIIDKGTHFDVTIDLKSGHSRYDIGRMIFLETVKAVPDFEELVDSYINEMFPDPTTYAVMLMRVADIVPQIPQEYLDEIEGIASETSGGTINNPGDGLLSHDEIFMMQLLADIARTTECSGLSVYGGKSATGNPISARILDWFDGSQNQLAQIQAVTTIKNGTKSICKIGYLTMVGVISGFNTCGVFAGILDAPTGEPYSSAGKRPYILDLRTALENEATIGHVADYLTDPSKEYTFNHLMLLSDKYSSGILENNISGTGTDMHRALRTDTSTLNPGITWGFDNAVAVVNAFMLSGNHDNYTGRASNTARWNTLTTQMQLSGETVSYDELKSIASFDHGDGPNSQTTGDIYNRGTQQIILFQPCQFGLEVSFKPKSGVLPTDPVFEKLECPFACGSTDVEADAQLHPLRTGSVRNRYCTVSDNSSRFSFSLETPSQVRVDIFNMLGRKLHTVDLGRFSAGKYKRDIRISSLPDGLYFYRLQTGFNQQ